MTRTLKSTLVFSAVGLLGPLVRFAAWPPSKFNTSAAGSIGNFLYDFVLLLWPTQPVAAVEVNVGSLRAAAMAITANLLAFAILGALVGIIGGTRARVFVSYMAVCVLIFLFDLWAAGFSFAYVNVLALAIVLLLYAIPFWVMVPGRAVQRQA